MSPNATRAEMSKGREARSLQGIPALLHETLRMLPLSAVVATIVINLTSLVLPLVTIQTYDRLIPHHATETLTVLAICVGGVIMFEAILKIARSQVVFWLATQNAWRAYGDALGRVLGAPRDWIVNGGASQILDGMRAQQALAEWHSSPSRLVLIDVPFVLLFIGLMAVVGGWMALVPTAVFGCIGVVLFRRGRELQNAARARASEDMRAQDFLVETIVGLPQIKGSAMENQMCRRYERLQGNAAYWSYETMRIAEDARGNSELLASLTQISTLAIGTIAVCMESMTAGTLAGCTMLAGRSVQPVLRFMSMWNEIQTLAVERDKSLAIWGLPASLPVAPKARSDGPISCELQKVSVEAENALRPALVGADLSISAGAVVSMLGNQGAGSSPLAALLCGHIRPRDGAVLVDGSDPVEKSAVLHGRVIRVLPSHRALGGTLLENLAMFRDAEGQIAGREAARLLGIEPEILQMPQGYETRVGDSNSSELSESLMQMVAIARAVALKPGLLILDEANQALDYRHSRMLEGALERIAESMTILLLTNRPSFAAAAQYRFVIEDGRFIQAQGAEPGQSLLRAAEGHG